MNEKLKNSEELAGQIIEIAEANIKLGANIITGTTMALSAVIGFFIDDKKAERSVIKRTYETLLKMANLREKENENLHKK